jgi:hypothetical protein
MAHTGPIPLWGLSFDYRLALMFVNAVAKSQVVGSSKGTRRCIRRASTVSACSRAHHVRSEIELFGEIMFSTTRAAWRNDRAVDGHKRFL